MKYYAVIIFLLLNGITFFNCCAQELEWIDSDSSPTWEFVYEQCMLASPNGDIYVGASFSDRVKLGGWRTVNGSSLDHAFLSKYDPQGRNIWAAVFASSQKVEIIKMVFQPSWNKDHIIILGKYKEDICVKGPGKRKKYQRIKRRTGRVSYFLVSFQQNGKLLWLKDLSAWEQNKQITGIAIDRIEGSIFTVGNFRNCVNSSNAYKPQEVINVPQGFVSKYDNQGNLLWTRKLSGGKTHFNLTGISTLIEEGTSRIVLTGTSVDVTDIGRDAVVRCDGHHQFLLLLDRNGVCIRSVAIPQTHRYGSLDHLSTDYSGNIFLAGNNINMDFRGVKYSGSGGAILKFNPMLELEWARGNMELDIYDIFLNEFGDIHITGFYRTLQYMDDHFTWDRLRRAPNGYDAIFAIYEGKNGNYKCAYKFGGAYNDIGHAIVAGNDWVVVGGTFVDGSEEGKPQRISGIKLHDHLPDFFIVKYSHLFSMQDSQMNGPHTFELQKFLTSNKLEPVSLGITISDSFYKQ